MAFNAAAAQNVDPALDLNGTGPGTSTAISYAENDPARRIAPAGTVQDPDSRDFGGGTLVVRITAGNGAADRLLIREGAVRVSEGDIFYRMQTDAEPGYVDVRIGTATGGTDATSPLVITLTDAATPDIVQELLRSVAFANYSDAPLAGDRTIVFTLTDGDGGTSAAAIAMATVTAVDDPAIARNDIIYAFEDAAAVGSVFADNGDGEDSDPDGTLKIIAINGQGTAVGTTIQLKSGALLTVQGDGTYTYDPNHAFNLATAGTGAVNTRATDSFSYTLAGGSTAKVTVNVDGVYNPTDVLKGDSEDNFIVGTGFADQFDMSQGGDDQVSGGGGNDAFYFGGTFSDLDRVDGGDGTDVVQLFGTYNFTFNAGSLANVERITLLSGTLFGGTEPLSYSLTTVDVNVAAGATLTILGTGLTSGETLAFNGSAETNGKFNIYGGAGADRLVGSQQADSIVGGAGDDLIYGLGGNDWIAGGRGADVIRGGLGADRYVYQFVTDSTARAFDIITDFEDTKDKIDLSAIDANSALAEDQAFTFIGANAFTRTAGELRAYRIEGNSWAVEADVDGDGTADLYIQVNVFNGHVMTGSDFLL